MRNIDWVNVLIWLVVMPIGALLSCVDCGYSLGGCGG